MSEKKLESGQEPGGGGLPTPRFEEPGVQQASSLSDSEIAALLKSPHVAQVIEDLVERKLQSEKDRRIPKIERRMDDAEKALAQFKEYLKAGMTPDQAEHQVKLDQTMEYVDQLRNSQAAFPASQPQGSGKEQAVAEAMTLLKEAGLENDPEVAQLFQSKTYQNGGELLKDVAALVIKRSTGIVNPAVAIQSGGGGVSSTPDAEGLTKELEGLLKLGVRMTPEQDKRRAEVVAELTKLVK